MTPEPLRVRLLVAPKRRAFLDQALVGLICVGRDEPADVALTDHDPHPGEGDVPVVRLVDEVEPLVADALERGVIADFVIASATPLELVARLERAGRRQSPPAVETWRREVDELLELVRDLAMAGELPDLLTMLVRRLADAAGVERCSVVLVDDHRLEPSVGRVVAASDELGENVVTIALERYPEIREALRSREPVVVTDASRHTLLDPVREHLVEAGVGAVAAFPLLDGDVAMGVLLLRSKTPLADRARLALGSTAAIATAIAVRHGRLAEEARAETAAQLARYEEFVAELSDGVAVLDDDKRVLLLNPAGHRILNCDRDPRGKPWADLARPLDPVASRLMFRQLAVGGRIVNADLKAELCDGTVVVLALGAGPLARHGRSILSFRDVTEQRRTEDDLRRTRDFLERLIEASTDAIVAADMDGRVVVFNRASEQLFEIAAEDALEKVNLSDLYSEAGAAEILRLLAESPDGEIDSLRMYGQPAGGQPIPVELSAAVVRVGDRAVATVNLLRDLRERVRAETELIRTRRKLMDAEKGAAITALAGATAHELNQPLTVVMGTAELLRRRVSPEHQRLVDTVQRETERMTSIVRKIATLTRVETIRYPGEKLIADLDRSVAASEEKS